MRLAYTVWVYSPSCKGGAGTYHLAACRWPPLLHPGPGGMTGRLSCAFSWLWVSCGDRQEEHLGAWVSPGSSGSWELP